MNFSEQLGWIDGERRSLIERLVNWCEINSGSYNRQGLALMAESLAGEYSRLGATAEWIALPPERFIDDDGNPGARKLGRALRFSYTGSTPYSVLLVGHMDTVFPRGHAFQHCDYLDDKRLQGPGAADMKGGLLVMLTALRALQASDRCRALGWEVLITPDEEIGSPGSRQLLAEAASRHQIGLLFEPTLPDGIHAGARSGSGNFDLLVSGRSAHAGREHHLGRNAVAALSRLTAAIDALNGKREGVTLNTARVIAGGAINVVPDKALLRFNVRVDSEESGRWVTAQLERVISSESGSEGIGVHLHGGFTRPPKVFSDQTRALFARLRQCGETLGMSIQQRATGGCCDGNNLAAAGLPNIDTLGVVGGNIHSASEYVELNSLCQRAKLCALLLHDLAGRPLLKSSGSIDRC